MPTKKHRQKLKNTTETLNTAADKATVKLKELSEWLSENGPCIPVYLEPNSNAAAHLRINKAVYAERESNWEKGTNYYLGYDRHGSKWALVFKEEKWKASDDINWSAPDVEEIVYHSINGIPRIVRIKAVKYLDELVAKISEEAEKLAEEITETHSS